MIDITNWLILLVEEELRDIIAEKLKELKEPEILSNPFWGWAYEDWPRLIRQSPHLATFELASKESVVYVKFWVKFNPMFGESYQDPIIIDEERMEIIVKRR